MSKSVKEQMQEMKEESLSCEDCEKLVRTRTQVVFGAGNPESSLVFVGEAPGENEDIQGKPFVGRAGQLLDEILKETGLLRDEIWITNIVKCRPTKLNESTGRLSNRAPLVGEIKNCQKWLEPELSLIDPTVIVCLGGPASSAIIHKGFKMTQERGQWFTDTIYAPFVIAAYHPAYVLRMHGASFDKSRQLLVDDIAAAKQKAIDEKGQPKMTLF
ncbi:uracil-DNA glycosylase [Candidatus Poribacteria bacterium]|nr:uracil-DNA glycosylase [Candidatus Poribacteria bacterium]